MVNKHKRAGEVHKLFMDKTIYANVDVEILENTEWPYNSNRNMRAKIIATDDEVNFPVGQEINLSSGFIAMRTRPQ